MKKYPLSTPAERTTGIAFSVVMVAALGLLLYVLRGNLPVLLLTFVGVALVAFVLFLYVMNVSRAAIIHDPDHGVLKVQGFRERTIDLSTVSGLQTITVKSGHVESRSLVFSNADGDVVSIVPTYFTSNRGMRAEPMAKELAAELGLDFQANVPEWEYDEEARKAHDLEVERQQKEDARMRREGKAKLRQAKMRKRAEEARKENQK